MTGVRTFHIFASDIVSETRLFKEARFTLSNCICEQVAVCGFWSDSLEVHETHSSGLEIFRAVTLIRRPRTRSIAQKNAALYALIACLSLLQYVVSVMRQSRAYRPSHVCCHNAILLPLCWLSALLSRAKLVYLPHELELERSGLSGLRKTVETFLEKRIIKRAQDVVVVCDPIAEWYRIRYGLDNVHVVRNMPEQSAVARHPIKGSSFRESFGIPDQATVFIYQGILGAARGTFLLIDTFKALSAASAHLVFMGYGDPETQRKLEEVVTQTDNIHFQPAVPAEEIISYAAQADIGVFVTTHSPLSYQWSLPNKFYEYIHAGLPVLVSENLTYLSDIIDRNQLGWSTPLPDLSQAIKAISETELAPIEARIQEFAPAHVWETDASVFSHVYRL